MPRQRSLISAIRSVLYSLAKLLGDASAVRMTSRVLWRWLAPAGAGLRCGWPRDR